MSLSDTASSGNGGVGERDCRWFIRAFLLIQIVIAVVIIRKVFWISNESIASILGIWLPGWLMRVDRVILLCVYALLLAGVVLITWPLKRCQRSVVSWAACWGLFNVFFIWLVLTLAHRVNDLIAYTTGREILISVWPDGILSWLLVNGLPVLGLLAGYGVAQALNGLFGGTLFTRRAHRVYFGAGLIVLLLGHLEPYIYRGLTSLGAFDWLENASLSVFIHFFAGYGLLGALPQFIWLGFGFKMLRRARRQVSHYPVKTECPRCGYDLRRDPESGCPECGWRRERQE